MPKQIRQPLRSNQEKKTTKRNNRVTACYKCIASNNPLLSPYTLQNVYATETQVTLLKMLLR